MLNFKQHPAAFVLYAVLYFIMGAAIVAKISADERVSVETILFIVLFLMIFIGYIYGNKQYFQVTTAFHGMDSDQITNTIHMLHKVSADNYSNMR